MLLNNDDFQEMVDELKKGQCFWVFNEDDEEDRFVYGVHLFFTLYFFEELQCKNARLLTTCANALWQ